MSQTDFGSRTLANFGSEPVARTLECALGLEGVPCVLKTSGFAAAWGYDIRGVAVQVANCNWETAQDVLHGHHEGRPWVCAACGADVDADFEVCWQCGAEQSNESTVASPQSQEALVEDHATETAVPAAVAHSLENLQTAWKAAVSSWFVPFGFLNIYSMSVLMQVRLRDLTTSQRGKYIATIVINCVIAVAWLALFSLR